MVMTLTQTVHMLMNNAALPPVVVVFDKFTLLPAAQSGMPCATYRAENSMRHLLLCLALIFFSHLHAAQTPSLDGQKIAVAFADENGKAQGTDELTFADGKLALPAIEKRYKFLPAPCTVSKEGKDIAFTATLKSGEHGQIVITGTITPNGAVSGKRTWGKNDKDPIVHTFTGALTK